MGFPRGSVIRNLPAKQETWVESLGWEDPLQKEMATYSSIVAWAEEPGGLLSTESQKSQTHCAGSQGLLGGVWCLFSEQQADTEGQSCPG